MNRNLIILGYISLAFTFIMAWVYYQERVLFVDPGNQLLNMINNGTFDIFVNRKSQAINLVLPLLAIKAGLSLRALMVIYSLSYVIIYILCFVISVHGYKNIAAGISIALLPIVIRTAFGHSISETWLGMCYSAVFYAMINYYLSREHRTVKTYLLMYATGCLLILINYYLHPVTLFSLLFALGFTLIQKKLYRQPHIYIFTAIILGMYIYKFLFTTDQYEDSFFAGVKKAPELLPHLTRLPLPDFMKIRFREIYIYPVIVLLAGLAGSLYQRKALLGGLTLLAFAGYLIIASLAFYKGEGNSMSESRLIPLLFFSLILLIEIFREMRNKWIMPAMLLLIMLITYTQLPHYMYSYHTRRLNVYRKNLEYIKQFPEKKFLTFRSPDPDPKINSWGGAIETLLMSSMDGKEHSRTIYYFMEKDTSLIEPWVYEPNCTYLWVPWYVFGEESQLNPQYFDLSCTAYREIPYTE